MECVSSWPLLQRNKIEDSKINVVLQAIADATIPKDEATAADTSVKSEADKLQSLIKSENVESVDVPISVDSTNGATATSVNEPNLEFGRGRTSERHECQAIRLKHLATEVIFAVLHTVVMLISAVTNCIALGKMGNFRNRLSDPKTVDRCR